MTFGAFVELAPGKDGLVHISKLADHRIEKVEDACKIGDMMWVKVTDIDEKGRVNLSHKDAMKEIAAKGSQRRAGQVRNSLCQNARQGGQFARPVFCICPSAAARETCGLSCRTQGGPHALHTGHCPFEYRLLVRPPLRHCGAAHPPARRNPSAVCSTGTAPFSGCRSGKWPSKPPSPPASLEGSPAPVQPGSINAIWPPQPSLPPAVSGGHLPRGGHSRVDRPSGLFVPVFLPAV